MEVSCECVMQTRARRNEIRVVTVSEYAQIPYYYYYINPNATPKTFQYYRVT